MSVGTSRAHTQAAALRLIRPAFSSGRTISHRSANPGRAVAGRPPHACAANKRDGGAAMPDRAPVRVLPGPPLPPAAAQRPSRLGRRPCRIIAAALRSVRARRPRRRGRGIPRGPLAAREFGRQDMQFGEFLPQRGDLLE